MSLVRVREEISKWLMRTQQGGRIVNMPLRFVTAASTLTFALKNTVLENYTAVIVGVFSLCLVVFLWGYDRFQVLNIQNRWNADRSDNYLGPTTAMNQLIQARQFSVLSQSIKEEWNREKTEEELETVTRKTIQNFRNGIDIGELNG